MDEEYVIFNFVGEILHRYMFSTDQHHQIPNPQMAFMSMAVLATASAVVATGMFSVIGSLLSSTVNPGFLSSKTFSRVIFFQIWHWAKATAFPLNCPPAPARLQHCCRHLLEWGIQIISLMDLPQLWSHLERLNRSPHYRNYCGEEGKLMLPFFPYELN